MLLLDLLKVVILGIIEGITEFLPISSTGHLIVASAILQPNFSPGLSSTFEIFIQLGAVIAVVLYYWRDLWWRLMRARTEPDARRFWIGLMIAVIPAGIVGFLVRDFIKAVLFTPVVVAIALIIGGVILILIERRLAQQPHSPPDEDSTALTYRQAALIGVAQVAALIPGVSRSAASIIGGMLVGLPRQDATRFSFYLAIPTLGGATVIDLLLSLDEIQPNDLLYLAVGTVTAGVVAWLAIGWLLRYVARSTFTAFGYYRIAGGIIILTLALIFNL
ncbi:MAG: undecaprenyl-diphosphatase [Phototrophicales bacterium]|nr:MAG: undecaprenyl-diphosphatase [Phototrophicales bacterium]